MERKHNTNIVPAAKMLRKNMTREERHLWYDYLRTHPARFSRQIVDFYSAQAGLVIELDGGGHYTEEAKRYDAERTAFLEEYGLSVVRIPNNDVRDNFRGVCDYIDMAVKQSLSQLPLHKGAFARKDFCRLFADPRVTSARRRCACEQPPLAADPPYLDEKSLPLMREVAKIF